MSDKNSSSPQKHGRIPYRIAAIFLCTLVFLFLACQHPYACSQTAGLYLIDSGQNTSIRGMSIPDNKTIWISGSNGHVARSLDAGATWEWMQVSGYEQTDFRDIHGFDAATAIIMGIGNPAYILKTRDGGQSWKLVYTKDTAGMFLDALDFRNEREGICIGDPLGVAGKGQSFFVIRTADGGDTWQAEPPHLRPPARLGEAVFSASGTNVRLLGGKDLDYAFISGGAVSQLHLVHHGGRHQAYPLSIGSVNESSGAFSMATDGKAAFYCIGGDYKHSDRTDSNLVWTNDKGKTWNVPTGTPPSGYLSCIQRIRGTRMIACGTNGVDRCEQPGKWIRISALGFNVCMLTPDKKRVVFAGARGRIAMLKI